MKEKKMKEHRRYVRIDVATKINLQVKGKAKEKKNLSAVSQNISSEGVCFKTDKQLAPGTELELEVFLPSEPKPLLLRGEVRWSQPIVPQTRGKRMFNTGVRLFTFNGNDENRYLKYVSQKMMERLSQYLHL